MLSQRMPISFGLLVVHHENGIGNVRASFGNGCNSAVVNITPSKV